MIFVDLIDINQKFGVFRIVGKVIFYGLRIRNYFTFFFIGIKVLVLKYINNNVIKYINNIKKEIQGEVNISFYVIENIFYLKDILVSVY